MLHTRAIGSAWLAVLLASPLVCGGRLYAGDGSNTPTTAPAQARPTWTAFGKWIQADQRELALARDSNVSARDGNVATSRPAPAGIDANLGYVPWQRRSGPAYPGDFWTSLGRWGKEMPATVWDDTVATFTNPVSLVLMGGVAATGVSLRSSGADHHIAENYTEHGPQLNHFWDNFGDTVGNPGTHFAVTGALLVTSLAANDTVNYEKMSCMMNALAINGATTLTLEVATNKHSPNHDPLSWPSGHTSSSFTFATVAWEEYGPAVGVPLMGLAGFIGYERIDARNHQFSDVISGALLGIAVGYAVSKNHIPRVAGFKITPTVDPAAGSVGVAFSKEW